MKKKTFFNLLQANINQIYNLKKKLERFEKRWFAVADYFSNYKDANRSECWKKIGLVLLENELVLQEYNKFTVDEDSKKLTMEMMIAGSEEIWKFIDLNAGNSSIIDMDTVVFNNPVKKLIKELINY